MELAVQARRNRGLTVHINKIHRANHRASRQEFGDDEGWLADITINGTRRRLICVNSPDPKTA
ncbi:hypothetical protein AJ88_37395 [Mesorhizobium amorphae CCBAU 01583]|nr:hypothetical protein AJ88_37395 [Mesorhizobium amorphae CCBAU 01583]